MSASGEKISKSYPETLLDPQDFIEGTEKMDGERKYGFGVDVMRTWSVGKDTDKNGFVQREDLV
jgi:hypothetical protein